MFVCIMYVYSRSGDRKASGCNHVSEHRVDRPHIIPMMPEFGERGRERERGEREREDFLEINRSGNNLWVDSHYQSSFLANVFDGMNKLDGIDIV